MKKKVCPYNFV